MTMTNGLFHEVLQDKENPSDWRVEAIDHKEGDVYVAIFTGPLAKELAEEYAAGKNVGYIPPVDRSKKILSNGSPVTDDHREIDPVTGQQKGYVVLSAGERAKGFVRPVRQTYTHLGKMTDIVGADEVTVVLTKRMGGCGTDTTMGRSIAETYARDPGFYSGTFCCSCRKHLPLDEFVWKGTEQQVGS